MHIRLTGVLTASILASTTALAGPLSPPAGPIAPTHKTLTQVEPRVPVQSLPGSATALHVISEPGAYYLTGNLTGQAGKHGIVVGSLNVTIDFGGFTLSGGPGSLDGIHAIVVTAPGYGTDNLSVHNGKIVRWGGSGINMKGSGVSAVGHVQLRDLVIDESGADGIVVGHSSAILNCVVSGGQGAGIVVGTHEFAPGVNADSGGIVSGCITHNNRGDGIRAIGARLVGNTNTYNGGDGIRLLGHCFVTQNLCERNGYFGPGAGIRAVGTGRNSIQRNAVSNNSGGGIVAESCDNLIIENSASANGTANYSLGSCNNYGQIVASPGAGFTMTNAAANFSY